jgi:uncharacterized protein (UPF0216 family)
MLLCAMGHCRHLPRGRRQLQEHLRASADFILRHNGQHTLLQACSRTCCAALAAAIPASTS